MVFYLVSVNVYVHVVSEVLVNCLVELIISSFSTFEISRGCMQSFIMII